MWKLLIWRWLPVFIYMLLIFLASDQSKLPKSVQIIPDYILHSSEYSILALLITRALAKPISKNQTTDSAGSNQLILLIIVSICFFYALSDEFHQSFVPGREASWKDILSDTVGSIIGTFLTFLIIVKYKKFFLCRILNLSGNKKNFTIKSCLK